MNQFYIAYIPTGSTFPVYFKGMELGFPTFSCKEKALKLTEQQTDYYLNNVLSKRCQKEPA